MKEKDIAEGLRKSAADLFGKMSDKLVDIGEGGCCGPVCPDSEDDGKYYPSITIPVPEDMYHMPGEECNILAVGEVTTLREGEIVVKVKKVVVLPEEAIQKEDE